MRFPYPTERTTTDGKTRSKVATVLTSNSCFSLTSNRFIINNPSRDICARIASKNSRVTR